jgi:hypothetical protein
MTTREASLCSEGVKKAVAHSRSTKSTAFERLPDEIIVQYVHRVVA